MSFSSNMRVIGNAFVKVVLILTAAQRWLFNQWLKVARFWWAVAGALVVMWGFLTRWAIARVRDLFTALQDLATQVTSAEGVMDDWDWQPLISGAYAVLGFINYLIPLDYIITAFVIVFTLYLLILVYRLIKSWIPTL